MGDPKERLTACISTAELERRWKSAREVMARLGIDYLVMRNDEEFLGGYVKWFSDFAARHSYPYTVIFPVDEEMTTITCGPTPPGEPFPPQYSVRGVKKRLAAPYFPSFHWTGTLDAELVVQVLSEKKGATVGLVGRSFIPVPFHEYIVGHLPGYKWVDATEEIDRLMVIKSPEEQEWIRKTAALQDAAMEHLKKTIRPGMRDFEVLAEAQYACVRGGSERQLILVTSDRPEGMAKYQFRHFQNRMIREGDRVGVLIETNGPCGFYTEVGRMFMLGKTPAQLQENHALALEAQEVSLKMLKPGANPAEIWEANNRFLTGHGCTPERRLYAHGQGYNLVERPGIRYDEPLRIQVGMNITVHPFIARDSYWATTCDNYLVTENGPSECIHKTPKKIFEI
jgi:Xaa-Pro aminopeptidase